METAMKLTKVFNIKPDKDSDESKQWTLELTIPAGTSERDLAQAVLSTEVIKVQNGNRSKYDQFPNGHVFRKTFNKPMGQVDAKSQFKLDAINAGIDMADHDAVIEYFETWIKSH